MGCMMHWGSWLGRLAIVVGSLSACGQELVMPSRKDPAASAAAGPSEGLTGAGGAAADDPAAKLPVLDEPVFTTFGGADSEEPAHPASAGTTSRGGSSASGGKAHGGSTTTPQPAAAGEGGAAGTGDVPEAPPPLLLFSEYVEGSGSFKALEIVALQGGSLANCELRTYFNGKSEPSSIALRGQLAAGELQVLCSKALMESQPSQCDLQVNLSFNGDDALALACDDVIQDIFGEIGVDPGEAWGAGTTLDHTLQRRCSVTAGRTDPLQPFDLALEWIVAPEITFADLRQRSCSAP
jgi:hypothetical protein